MKRIAAVLVALVLAGSLAACGGGDSGPTGSTTDITGRWDVTFNGDDQFYLALAQIADGTLEGYVEPTVIPTDFDGSWSGTEYTFQFSQRMGTTLFTIYDCKVTLYGDDFDGTCTYVSMWATEEDKPVKGKRA